MVELTITYGLGSFFVATKHMTSNRMINPTIACSTLEEAKEIYEQLNGKKLQDIEAFIKLRNKFAV